MADETENKLPTEVRFVYRKTRHHRTVQSDGAWAAITPQLEVQIALFKDLRLMPDEVTNLITEKGVIGTELSKSPPDTDMPVNVLREVSVTVVISKETAKSLIDVLGQMVEKIEKHIETINAISVRPTVSDSERT